MQGKRLAPGLLALAAAAAAAAPANGGWTGVQIQNVQERALCVSREWLGEEAIMTECDDAYVGRNKDNVFTFSNSRIYARNQGFGKCLTRKPKSCYEKAWFAIDKFCGLEFADCADPSTELGQRQLYDAVPVELCDRGKCKTVHRISDRHMSQCVTNQWLGDKRKQPSLSWPLLTETCSTRNKAQQWDFVPAPASQT